MAEEKKKESVVSVVDASKATRIATEYLEGIYGNLSMLLFRIEDVQPNTDNDKYFVLCSLLTNVGGPRSYYYIKVNITNGGIIKISKGLRNPETGEIEWKIENLPKD
ncbi:MAG: hypothetical protein Q8L27_00835 [archaeon]|nr:hypothetical protein [archaeon]